MQLCLPDDLPKVERKAISRVIRQGSQKRSALELDEKLEDGENQGFNCLRTTNLEMGGLLPMRHEDDLTTVRYIEEPGGKQLNVHTQVKEEDSRLQWPDRVLVAGWKRGGTLGHHRMTSTTWKKMRSTEKGKG